MTTNPEEPLEEETPVEKAGHIARTVIAGNPRGAVRRIILYIIAYVSLLAATYPNGTALTLIAGIVCVGAFSLLLATDQLL